MRIFFFNLIFFLAGNVKAQDRSFRVEQQDTITLTQLNFKKSVALHVDGAIILTDYNSFVKALRKDKALFDKKIKEHDRLLKKKDIDSGLILAQRTHFKARLNTVESTFANLKSQDSDTAVIIYSNIAGFYLVYFITEALDSKKCMVMDLDKKLQTRIIKQTGSKATGEWTGVGLSCYFILGAKQYFWSTTNWIS